MNIVISGFNFFGQIPLNILKEFQVDYCHFVHLEGIVCDLPNVREWVCLDLEQTLWANYPVDWNEITPLDEELIVSMRDCEAILYKMMDFLERWYFLAYYERKLFYYRHLRYWNHILESKKIDLFVLCEIPHSLYDYVIYALCKLKKIPVVMMNYSGYIHGCSFVIEDIEKSATQVAQKYAELIQADTDPDTVELSPLFLEVYQSQTRRDVDPVPYNMQMFQAVEAGLLPPTALSAADARWEEKNKPQAVQAPAEASRRSGVDRLKALYRQLRYWKQRRNQRLQEQQQQQAEQAAQQAAAAYDQQLRCAYDQHTVVPDLSQKYIYVPLHYQPECSTSPMAGAYVDQVLVVQLLAKALPEGVLLYVKEHPGQKQIGRNLFFYQDLLAIKQVRFVPRDFNSFRLIENCLAIATGTGSAGWEGLFREKPVLMFGHYFCQYAPGVFQVQTLADCQAALRKIIEDGFKPSQANMKLFLKAVEEVSIRGFTDPICREPSGLTDAESVHNISTALIQRIKQLGDRSFIKN